jgi:predicted small lipoprotein YifL
MWKLTKKLISITKTLQNMKKVLSFMLAIFAISILASCGGTPELKLSEKAKLLMDKTWYPDTKADTQFGGDVAKIGDFMSGKYYFGTAKDDPSDLVYSITIGEGFLSTTSGAGRWKLDTDDKTLLLYPWDYDKKEYKTEPTKYNIEELTADKLVWKTDGMYTEHFSTTKP